MNEGRENINYINPLLQLTWICKDEEGKPVCNFCPRVLETVERQSASKSVLIIRLKLIFEHSESEEFSIRLSDLDKIDWGDRDSRCILNPDYRGAQRYIANMIRTSVCEFSPRIVYCVGRTGIHHFGKTTVFVAGDRVISRSSESIDIDCSELSFKLDIDLSLTVNEAIAGMKNLINLSPEIGRILVAYAISGITRAALEEVGFIPRTVLVVVGESGMLKSHYVPHIVQLYNRKDGIRVTTRFNSTSRFMEDVLCAYSDCTAVIDDLHTAQASGIKRRNEAAAEEIIRRISDDMGRGRMEGHKLVQHAFSGNVVFIGEYTIGKDSTVPRVLIVNLTKRPNGAILDDFQRHQPLLVSTFYYFFIQWYVDHFDGIRDGIDEKLTRFREASADSNTHGRLCDAQFSLQIAYMLFLEFCKDSGFISQENARDEYQRFGEYLAKLVKEQQARFKSNIQAEKVDYLNLIRNLYKQGRFCVAKKKKDFNPDKHEGVICYDCLCLRGKYLERKIKNINASLCLEDCIKKLLAQNVLKLVENKYTVQISGTGGKRFYAIKLNKLV